MYSGESYPRESTISPFEGQVMDLRQRLIAAWGVVGVSFLLGQAIVRMTPIALEPWQEGTMSPLQMGLYLGWVALNAYLEGHRGFHLRFSPRVVSRAFYLGSKPKLLWIVLAVPFCMSFFHAKRRQMIVSWVLLLTIASLVILIKYVPQPWRGIIDGGVVIGLLWGLGSLWWYFLRAFLGHRVPPLSDLPPPQDSTR